MVYGREREKAWGKLEGCRGQALEDEFDWIWDDTCCTDKSSSVELSEAINSMFNWYQGAAVYYAYLSDVSGGLAEAKESNSDFRRSKWFTRGWTLHELFAPGKLLFFDRNRVRIERRGNLESVISEIPGIRDVRNFDHASLSQKMSWAAKRETTRIEDMAYGLLGLFKVNMPPLYGEGERAFIRLQREILLVSDDETIFPSKDRDDLTGSLLARSGAAFQDSGHVVQCLWDDHKPYYLMTSKGLHMECPLFPSPPLPARLGSITDTDDTFLAPLQCQYTKEKRVLAVLLRRIVGSTFARVSSGELLLLWPSDASDLQLLMDSRNRLGEERIILNVKKTQIRRCLFVKWRMSRVNIAQIKDASIGRRMLALMGCLSIVLIPRHDCSIPIHQRTGPSRQSAGSYSTVLSSAKTGGWCS